MKKLFSTLVLLAASVLLFSCANSKKLGIPISGDSELLYKSQWNLIELQGIKVTVKTQPHLAFYSGTENKVVGNTGCNSLSGQFQLSEKDIIKFTILAITRRACVEENVESNFVNVLSEANTWRIVGNELLLSKGKILLAKFIAATKN